MDNGYEVQAALRNRFFFAGVAPMIGNRAYWSAFPGISLAPATTSTLRDITGEHGNDNSTYRGLAFYDDGK